MQANMNSFNNYELSFMWTTKVVHKMTTFFFAGYKVSSTLLFPHNIFDKYFSCKLLYKVTN